MHDYQVACFLICIWACWLGIDRLAREPEGSTRTYEESNGDEQDSEAGQCWNCPSQMKLIIGLLMR